MESNEELNDEKSIKQRSDDKSKLALLQLAKKIQTRIQKSGNTDNKSPPYL